MRDAIECRRFNWRPRRQGRILRDEFEQLGDVAIGIAGYVDNPDRAFRHRPDVLMMREKAVDGLATQGSAILLLRSPSSDNLQRECAWEIIPSPARDLSR
jgi:hypothetical protein